MNFNYIDIDEASINKRLEKCKELIIDSRYKNMYIKMEYISILMVETIHIYRMCVLPEISGAVSFRKGFPQKMN